MMTTILYLWAFLWLAGHIAVGVATFNRSHSFGRPYQILHVWDLICSLFLVALPLVVISLVWRDGPGVVTTERTTLALLLRGHFFCCLGALVWVIGDWTQRTFFPPSHSPLLANHTRQIDVAAEIGYTPFGTTLTRVLGAIPGNQILDLHLHEKRLQIEHLPETLRGLKIAHLSDLHMTGQLTREFFDTVVEQTNAWQPDLVAITGDIIDKRRCLDWLPETLGRLEARHGCYFVLGNHDDRPRCETAIRGTLVKAGLVDLGGNYHVATVGAPNGEIVLVGNELPWFGPAADLDAAKRASQFAENGGLLVALCHTPDRIDWARTGGVQLMLAGHTHGGQFRLPIIGPVLSPSRYGVRYASGTFYLSPTVLHVSRGLSGTRQVRFRCPPELALITLEPTQ